jgi:copper chaperone CopZ
VRSALLAVKGVKRARVSLDTHEALVTYDPRQVKIASLLEAVKKAQTQGDQVYSATVKKPKK